MPDGDGEEEVGNGRSREAEAKEEEGIKSRSFDESPIHDKILSRKSTTRHLNVSHPMYTIDPIEVFPEQCLFYTHSPIVTTPAVPYDKFNHFHIVSLSARYSCDVLHLM